MIVLALDLDIVSFILFIGVSLLIYVYRNPKREITVLKKDSVLSPVDGKVISIKNINNTEYSYKIEIDSKFSNIGILRTPIAGTVVNIEILHGAMLSDNTPLSKKINEFSSIIIKDENLNSIKVEHLSKLSFEPISIDVHCEQKLACGARYGFMMNGITTIYMPKDSQINLSVGDDIIASKTVIGDFA